VARKSGTWFSFGEIRLGQGRERSVQFLRDNPNLLTDMRLKVYQANGFNADGSPIQCEPDEAKIAEGENQ